MKGFSVILLICLIFHNSLALPKPEGDGNGENDTTPAPIPEKINSAEKILKNDDDESQLFAVPKDDNTTDLESKEDALIPPIPTKAPPEIKPVILRPVPTPKPDPVANKESSENDDDTIIVVPEKSDTVTQKPVDKDLKDECGPACQLASQTPLILFIVILVVIILLLIILFGCYFMKKLYGKAILTANKNLQKQPSDITHRTFDSKAVVDPTTGTQKIVTTTTTHVTKSVGAAYSDVAL